VLFIGNSHLAWLANESLAQSGVPAFWIVSWSCCVAAARTDEQIVHVLIEAVSLASTIVKVHPDGAGMQ
jgi:type IV secretory pathway TrbD component